MELLAKKYLGVIKRQVDLKKVTCSAYVETGQPAIKLEHRQCFLQVLIDMENRVYHVDYRVPDEEMSGELEEKPQLLYLIENWVEMATAETVPDTRKPGKKQRSKEEVLNSSITRWEQEHWNNVVLLTCPHCGGTGEYVERGRNYGMCYQCEEEGVWTGRDACRNRLYHGAAYVAAYVPAYPYATEEEAKADLTDIPFRAVRLRVLEDEVFNDLWS